MLDQQIGSLNWIGNWIIKLDHEICQINDPNFLTHVLCSISRAKVSIQFCVSDPILRSNFPFPFQFSDPPFRSNISASQPACHTACHHDYPYMMSGGSTSLTPSSPPARVKQPGPSLPPVSLHLGESGQSKL